MYSAPRAWPSDGIRACTSRCFAWLAALVDRRCGAPARGLNEWLPAGAALFGAGAGAAQPCCALFSGWGVPRRLTVLLTPVALLRLSGATLALAQVWAAGLRVVAGRSVGPCSRASVELCRGGLLFATAPVTSDANLSSGTTGRFMHSA